MGIIQQAITAVKNSSRWHNISPYDINNGNCDSFANDVIQYMKNLGEECEEAESDIDAGEPGHVFVKYSGKFYDAECLEGVEEYHHLPIFNEEFSKYEYLEKLAEEERKEIEEQSRNAICTCGHKKNEHSRFIAGMFVGCQSCTCQSFKWS